MSESDASAAAEGGGGSHGECSTARWAWFPLGGVLLCIALGVVAAMFHAHPALDDITRATAPKEMAFWEAAWAEYLGWSGRWAGIGLEYGLFRTVDLERQYGGLLLGAWLVFALCLVALTRLHLRASWGSARVWLAVGVVLGIHWGGMSHPGETVFWATGAIENVASFALWLTMMHWAWRSGEGGGWGWRLPVIAVLGFVFPGLHELYAVVLFPTLLWAAWWGWRRGGGARVAWCVALVSAALGIGFVLMAPGNEGRSTYWPLAGQPVPAVKTALRIGVPMIVSWLTDPALLLATVLVLFTNCLPRPVWAGRIPGGAWAVAGLGVLAVGGAIAGPAWATGQDIPFRTRNAAHLIFTLFWFVGCLSQAGALAPVGGLRLRRTVVLTAMVLLLALSLAAAPNSVKLLDDFRQGRFKTFDESMKERYRVLREAAESGRGGVIVVPRPADRPFVFWNADIQSDPEFPFNQMVAKYFGVDGVRRIEPGEAMPVAAE